MACEKKECQELRKKYEKLQEYCIRLTQKYARNELSIGDIIDPVDIRAQLNEISGVYKYKIDRKTDGRVKN